MKIELINENQLKIHLEEEDIHYLKLSDEKIDYRNTQVRTFFWEVMKIAKEQNGFDAFNSHLILETLKSDAGYFMIVTRGPKSNGLFRVKKSVSAKKQTSKSDALCAQTFRFNQLEDLINCCKKIKEYNDILYNALYIWDNAYYLAVTIVCIKPQTFSPTITHILCEYATCIGQSNFDTFLREHATPILPFGAIERIQKVFST